MKISVLILNWNGGDDTLACLDALCESSYRDVFITVVDNASSDGSVTAIEQWEKERAGIKRFDFSGPTLSSDNHDIPGVEVSHLESDFVLLQAERNLGFADGCNVGIEFSLSLQVDAIMLLNNDALVNKETLEELVNSMMLSGAGIVGARVFPMEGDVPIYEGRRWPYQLVGLGRFGLSKPVSSKYMESDDVDGCAALISSNVARQRLRDDGFVLDPAYFLYWEEVDLCRYSASKKNKCIISRDGTIRHHVGKSSGGDRMYYYLTRNRVFIANKWLPFYLRIAFHLYYIPSRIVIQAVNLVRGRTGTVLAVYRGVQDAYFGYDGKSRFY